MHGCRHGCACTCALRELVRAEVHGCWGVVTEGGFPCAPPCTHTLFRTHRHPTECRVCCTRAGPPALPRRFPRACSMPAQMAPPSAPRIVPPQPHPVTRWLLVASLSTPPPPLAPEQSPPTHPSLTASAPCSRPPAPAAPPSRLAAPPAPAAAHAPARLPLAAGGPRPAAPREGWCSFPLAAPGAAPAAGTPAAGPHTAAAGSCGGRCGCCCCWTCCSCCLGRGGGLATQLRLPDRGRCASCCNPLRSRQHVCDKNCNACGHSETHGRASLQPRCVHAIAPARAWHGTSSCAATQWARALRMHLRTALCAQPTSRTRPLHTGTHVHTCMRASTLREPHHPDTMRCTHTHTHTHAQVLAPAHPPPPHRV